MWSSPRCMAREGSDGVDGNLKSWRAPSFSKTKSVKVPPVSTPTRTRTKDFLGRFCIKGRVSGQLSVDRQMVSALGSLVLGLGSLPSAWKCSHRVEIDNT